jgi:hypothetical protein
MLHGSFGSFGLYCWGSGGLNLIEELNACLPFSRQACLSVQEVPRQLFFATD